MDFFSIIGGLKFRALNVYNSKKKLLKIDKFKI